MESSGIKSVESRIRWKKYYLRKTRWYVQYGGSAIEGECKWVIWHDNHVVLDDLLYRVYDQFYYTKAEALEVIDMYLVDYDYDRYLESLLPMSEDKLREKYWREFDKRARYVGNYVYEWEGIRTKDTRTLWLMGILKKEKVSYEVIERK